MAQSMATAVLLVAGCTSAPAQNTRPALIVDPTAASRADLLDAVRAALNNAPVTLADDALTHENLLLIERQRRLDPQGLPANGRELGLPERFLLSIDGKRCVLTHERTQRHWVLTHTHCKARD